jgi:hypothetical protein
MRGCIHNPIVIYIPLLRFAIHSVNSSSAWRRTKSPSSCREKERRGLFGSTEEWRRRRGRFSDGISST